MIPLIKVLIADDEPKIRNGLLEAVDWGKMGMTVVGLARDGEEALKMAEEFRPDLCLVDICMPFLNGLDLIEKLKELNPGIIPIIITGHDEFDYAQRAVKLKAFDYILKPVCEEDLAKIIRKAKDDLEESRDREKRYEWAQQQLQKNLPLLRQRFVSDWLEGSLTPEEIKEEIGFYDLQLEEKIGIAVLKTPGVVIINNQYDERERQLMLYTLENILDEMLEPFRPSFIIRNSAENLVVLASVLDQDRWKDLKTVVEEKVSQLMGQTVTVYQDLSGNGVAGVFHSYQEIARSIIQQEHCLPLILKVKNYLEVNFQDPELSLQQIATDFQLSLSYLSKLFKQETGMSFIDYLIKMRITEAIRLMTNHPQLKIYEIADRVGYNSQHYFCAAFKKVLGVSPTEYRQRAV